jgi:multidrug efflux pump subunit AcrA (membrane-fusion protein)
MFTRVRLTVQTSEEEIVMPDRALLTTDSGETVAFVVENGLAKERRVTLGIERGSCIQVLEGIKPGDQVIVAGHEKIKNNAPVDEIPLQGSVPCFASPGKGLEP